MEAVIPVCIKLRCLPIAVQVGRTITYSIASPHASEFV